jgi:hypothetical protein
MHGDEKLVPRKLQYQKVEELNEFERLDLAVFSAMPASQSLYKLMEFEILKARDEAMAVEPSNKELVLSKQAIAHTMALFYTRVRKAIEGEVLKHKDDIANKANKENKMEQEEIERIVLSNIQPGVPGLDAEKLLLFS